MARRLPRSVSLALAVVLALGGLLAGQGPASAKQKAKKPKCVPRVLVFTAYPAEMGPLLEAATIDRSKTVEIDGKQFWIGRLAGNDVILAMTGIGPANADKTAKDAFAHFRCGDKPGISAVVFSGVAGVKRIGDVAVPEKWTPDRRKTWYYPDPTMLAIARTTAPVSTPKLESQNPAGDPACACVPPGTIKTVQLAYQPEVVVGGEGESSDPFGGRRLPCVPNGGNIFGCEPCREQKRTVDNTQRFIPGILPFLPDFFFEYLQAPQETDTSYAAQDEETAAVAAVATTNHTPFLGFRGGSDGGGDPLMLPGFPFQFFFYQELAAHNSAIAAIDFLTAWAHR